MWFDGINVVVFSLELLELESLIEIVDIFALLEFINNYLEVFEILNDLCLDSSLGGLVGIWLIYDSSEPWSFFADEAMNELMEISMVDDSNYFFSNGLHVSKKFIKLVDEFTLSWLEWHTITFGVKINGRWNGIFGVILTHFDEDEVSTFLINLNLSLDDHVVNQSNEGSKTVVVSLSKLKDSVLELILLLLKNHGLVLGSLAHFGVFEVFLFLKGSWITDSSDE